VSVSASALRRICRIGRLSMGQKRPPPRQSVEAVPAALAPQTQSLAAAAVVAEHQPYQHNHQQVHLAGRNQIRSRCFAASVHPMAKHTHPMLVRERALDKPALLSRRRPTLWKSKTCSRRKDSRSTRYARVMQSRVPSLIFFGCHIEIFRFLARRPPKRKCLRRLAVSSTRF
jgi:hypothetical protein